MAMNKFLFILVLASAWPLIIQAQQRKPCGTSVLQQRRASRNDYTLKARARTADATPVIFEGEKRGLVILVSFPNQSFSEPDPKSAWTARICEEGYSEHKAPGSVADYFRDQSYGQFRLLFDVVGPVEMAHPYEYYGKNVHSELFDDWFDERDDEMVVEACRAVADSVRFADYDWYGDGMVDQVFLLYAGHGEGDYWQKSEDVIWPHMGLLTIDWAYPRPLKLQGMSIDAYACSNEIDAMNAITGIGTMCHEFSHCLGLPDLYNTLSGTTVVGSYDLMDSGNYNSDGWCPPGYSSYERYACGWLHPQPVDDLDAFVDSGEADLMQPLHLQPDARIYQPVDDTGYYLIERREKNSWDASLPKVGVQAWYIDYDKQAWEENLVNTDASHYRVNRLMVGDIPAAITSPISDLAPQPVAVYDLHGRQYPLTRSLPKGILIFKYADGTVRKK